MKNTYIMEHEKKLMIASIAVLSIIAILIFRSWHIRQTIRGELELANLSISIQWFGTDSFCNKNQEDLENVDVIARKIGVDSIILLRSPCTEDTITHTLIWQENGLVDIGILNQDQVNAILTAARFNHIGSLAQADVEALLTGGFPLLDESEFHAERFLNAVSDIDSILRDLNIDINIQESWYALIRGN